MSGAAIPFLKHMSAMNLGCGRIFRIILMLTARCPLQCRICGIWKGREKTDPSLHDLESFFTRNSFSWINLTGGEIFMRRDMAELFHLIKRTQKELMYLSLPSSGYLVEETKAGVEAAIRSKLPHLYVTISFDGGPQTHDALRKGDHAFQRAKETYHALKGLAAATHGVLKVVPGLTLSSELLALSRDPVNDLVQELGLDGPQDVHINLSHTAPHYYRNPDLVPLSTDETISYIRKQLEQGRTATSSLKMLESLYLKGAIQYLKTGRPPLACKACSASVFVDSQWNVFPCTHFPFPIGSLQESGFDLSPLVSSQPFKEAQSKVSAGDCPGCWTPCEAFTSLTGSLIKPSFYKLASSETFGGRLC
ncbi:MAG: radical SAM protein [Planctomycetota bacterium]